MRVTTLCLVCSISLPPSIRCTMMFWPNACRRRTGSTRPIGFAHTSAIADKRSSSTGSFLPSSLCCGVPQASVLGPLLFLRLNSEKTNFLWCVHLDNANLGELAASLDLSYHFYADDSQLYTWGPIDSRTAAASNGAWY